MNGRRRNPTNMKFYRIGKDVNNILSEEFISPSNKCISTGNAFDVLKDKVEDDNREDITDEQ